MKTNSKVRAFSLIELSIVILIIGILIAGVTQGSRILSQAKLNNARTLTKSAPVSSIKNLAFWVEATSEESFPDANAEDGQEIITWYDLNPQTGSKSNLAGTAGTAPLYKTNIINGLPTAYFAGTDEFMAASAFPNIVTRSSTVFMVVKLPSALPSAPAAILSKRATTTTLSSPNIQVSFDGTTLGQAWQYCDGAGAGTDDSICNELSSNDDVAVGTPYVVSIVYVSNTADGASATTSTGINFFQNGVSSGTSATNEVTNGNPDTAGTGALFLGKHGATGGTEVFFSGYIGELIIYDRNLKKEERQAVEAYLGKKWGVAMTTASY
jgi:prepilin-type N-terminal cleavage/methylation domain-containing protein